ncbi:hypothetical protein Bcop_1911 [Bacteroides coprosuis DSM 18011]|uniref:Major fimbrial subunit protein N-terminal domain-containing protein n=1 Tax=Bacteroides coprosuis DSM 18011 TaxID=679937 RepID=F3ZS72_9BACE|nr:FimB/Mfa2 family fimbrial subunit [Bacteroides coprosuis]EGJ72093.1 hypothetical protein Bcop_1911 [Bacteroides coprosuis DSM 18011]
MKNSNSIIALCLALFSFFSCVGEESDKSMPAEKVYLSTRVGTVNQDNVASEDYVSEVRVMAFQADDGACVKNELLTFNGNNQPTAEQNRSDQITLLSGTYDFLFIANESSYNYNTSFKEALLNIRHIVQLEDEVFTTLKYEPTSDSEQGKGILMSAFYPGVLLEEKGENESVIIQDVELLRAFAKIEIQFHNKVGEENFKEITKVSFHNVPKHYTVPAANQDYLSIYPDKFTSFEKAITFTEEEYKKETIGSVVFYVPEFLRYKDNKVEKYMDITIEGIGFLPHQIRLAHQHFEDYKQPRTLSTELLSTTTVLRNTHYKVDVNLTASRDLESVLKVLPWQFLKSEISYTDPSWTLFKIEVGGKDVIDQKEISLKSGEEAKVTFELDEPSGAIWKASLTNGRFFEFTDPTTTTGLAGTEYTFSIKASQDWNGSFNYTEFYISVNGEELKLREDGVGIGNRYVFKQVE